MASYRNPYNSPQGQAISSIGKSLGTIFAPSADTQLYQMRAADFQNRANKYREEAKKAQMDNEAFVAEREQNRVLAMEAVRNGLTNSLFPGINLSQEAKEAYASNLIRNKTLGDAFAAQVIGDLQTNPEPSSGVDANNYLIQQAVRGGRNPTLNMPGSMAGAEAIRNQKADAAIREDKGKQKNKATAKDPMDLDKYQFDALDNLKMDLETDIDGNPLDFGNGSDIDNKISQYMAALAEGLFIEARKNGSSFTEAMTKARMGMTTRQAIKTKEFKTPGFNVELPALLVADLKSMGERMARRVLGGGGQGGGLGIESNKVDAIVGEIFK